MCGIIGYVGKRDALPVIFDGLRFLEYRGYDSAGVAVFDKNTGLRIFKAKGRINAVESRLDGVEIDSQCGIGHTRWATHGQPSDENSHPHFCGKTCIVHNGIIENYAKIRQLTAAEGYTFASETDTEAAAAMIDLCYRREGDPLKAIRAASAEFIGSYAFGIVFSDRPGEIYAARKDSPLIVGLGSDEYFIASDITAVLKYTKRYFNVGDGEFLMLTRDRVCVFDSNLRPIQKAESIASWDVSAAEKGGYEHFMLKEIHEEPEVARRTLHSRLLGGVPDFTADGIDDAVLDRIHKIDIVACGTAMHAGLYGKYLIEKYARIPVNVEIASEYRYRNPILSDGDVVIIISQSGETADSLAALRLANARGAFTIAVVNVIASSIAREAKRVIYTHAGPEIAVASTKAFVVQASVMAAFATRLALSRGQITNGEAAKMTAQLADRLPSALAEVTEMSGEIREISKRYCSCEDMFFIGRGVDSYLAEEGSLKLKEISYIHSEAYAAGELKHGTISLITDGVPVIALMTEGALAEKMISNIREVTARGGSVFIIGKSDAPQEASADVILRLPEADELILPILAVSVCQLFAYHMSTLRGCDVDKPRNLAKAVTVE